jgi:preprotein translocase subunit SecD
MAKLTWRIWLLLILVLLSVLAIFGMPPKFLQSGVLITSVESNSTAFEQGLRQGQIITSVDGVKINNPNEFSTLLENKFLTNNSVKTIFETNNGEVILFTSELPKITISEIPNTNIKTGLDLSGGARALVQAENHSLSKDEVNDLVSIVENRFNVFGISDVRVSPVSDLSANNFVLIEIAGATPSDLDSLISQQGKFEAKVGNDTVFIGGERDITSVSRSGQQSGITSCLPDSTGGYFCNFQFVVYLSPEAAQRHADITKNLEIITQNGQRYLSQSLDLYVDDNLVDTLLIGESLRGRVTTEIMISGSGQGPTQEEAYNMAETNMNQLQTVLITGSLPFKLEVVKLDTISPTLGNDFIKAIMLAGIGALLAVAIIVFVRYQNFKASMALVFTSFSEIILILGIAALIGWNLDLPSIAGILATIGTGVDQQIIIIDESRREKSLTVAQRLKRAFVIIVGAYFTALVSLLPLMWVGAGLLKGFAVTTLIGITAGVLISRPAFTDMIRKMEE